MALTIKKRSIVILVSLLAMLVVQFAALHMHAIPVAEARVWYTHSHIIEAITATPDPLLQNNADEVDLQTPSVLGKQLLTLDVLIFCLFVIASFLAIFKPLLLSHVINTPLKRYCFHFRPPLRAPPLNIA